MRGFAFRLVQEETDRSLVCRIEGGIQYMHHDQVFSKSIEYFSKKFEKVLVKVPNQA